MFKRNSQVNILFLKLIISLSLAYQSYCQVPPTWITSSYVNADSKKIIDGDLCNCRTGNKSTPTATLTFLTAFLSPPNIGYGVSNYQGDDTLANEMYEVNRTGLTSTYFSVKVQISGITNLWMLEVRYIAISILFPHHLNSFDNVPVNYNNGALSNITNPSLSIKTYTNTINFTSQSILAGSNYTSFSIPLSNNKILLFITSLFIKGNFDYNQKVLYPLNLEITATPITNQTYKIIAQFSMNSNISRLHFSMIIFDFVDVQSSNQYLLIYQQVCYNSSGGFYPFPAQFINNFMIGFLEFSTIQSASLVHFENNFIVINGKHGVFMPTSIPRNKKYVPLTRFCFTVFYMKQWRCPNLTFFDKYNDVCRPCSIYYCLNCSSLTTCALCDESDGYFLNITSGTCDPCTLVGCLNCSSPTTCLRCDETQNYILASNNTCTYCNVSLNIFANHLTHTCDSCSISNCIICETLSKCSVCDTNNSYYLSPWRTCLYCNNSLNYFLDTVTMQCDFCTVEGCSNCSSLQICQTCNSTANYVIQNSTCLLCPTNSFANPVFHICELCNIFGCLYCSSLTSCQTCDQSNGYYFNSLNGQCLQKCGDGIRSINEECDDSNSESYDGCSSTCKIQNYFICNGTTTSACFGTVYIDAQFQSIKKQGCNSFKLVVVLKGFTLSQISNNFVILNKGTKITEAKQNGQLLQLLVEYSQDIGQQKIILKFYPGTLLSITYDPNITPLKYTPEQCKAPQQVLLLLKIIQGTSYIALILSILSCKIIGLQLFGVLQISYFTLAQYDFLNIYLSPLAQFKTFNGLNLLMSNQSISLPSNFSKLKISSQFLNNCNLMLLLLYLELILGVILYATGKKTQRQSLSYIGEKLLKQGFITFILFNIFNLSFSAGMHWKYSSPSDQNYVVGSIFLYLTIILIVIAVFAMQIANNTNYGEFKSKFKNSWICRVYVPITIIYRIVLGLYTALNTDSQVGSLIILAFVLAFIMYNISNFPFNQTYQNYRATFIHLTTAYILITTNYYRGMKSTTSIQIKGRIYGPAVLELALIFACLFFSLIALIYEICKDIRKYCRRSKRLEELKKDENKEITEQSLEQI